MKMPPPQICATIDALYSSGPSAIAIRVVYAAQAIGSTASLALLTFLFLHLSTKQRTLPLNARLLMANLTVAFLLANVGTLFSVLYHLHVQIFRPPESRCYWLQFTRMDCYVVRSIFNAGVFCVYTSSMSFALDRLLNSLLLIPEKRTKKANPSQKTSAHCVTFAPTPTQVRPYFFTILGVQAFALATYSILTYHNNFDKVIDTELRRLNAVVFENVVAVEQTLPAVACIVALFLASVFLDGNLVSIVSSVISGGREEDSQHVGNNRHRGGSSSFGGSTANNNLIDDARWNEYQTLAIPIVSLAFFVVVFLQTRMQKAKQSERIYEHIQSTTSASGEDYYENQSDCLSFKTTDFKTPTTMISAADSLPATSSCGSGGSTATAPQFRQQQTVTLASKNDVKGGGGGGGGKAKRFFGEHSAGVAAAVAAAISRGANSSSSTSSMTDNDNDNNIVVKRSGSGSSSCSSTSSSTTTTTTADK